MPPPQASPGTVPTHHRWTGGLVTALDHQHLPAKGNHVHHLYQYVDTEKPNQRWYLGTGTSWLIGLSPKAT